MNMEIKPYRWLLPISCIFVTTLVISNIIAVKLMSIAGVILPAAVILFPVAYIIGDLLTEVYGYGQARQVIWIGFLCNLIAVLAIWLGGVLPSPSFWNAGVYSSSSEAEMAYRAILGFTPRLLVASFSAYLIGEFLNSYILARLKVKTGGRFLWIRTIGSTIFGQAADSLVFVGIAFMGIVPRSVMVGMIISQWIFKIAYEALATPLTYLAVNALKRSEGADHFDLDTNFNPLRIFQYKQ